MLDYQLGGPYNWFLISLGGVLGTLMRHFFITLLPLHYYNKLVVNIIACGLLGWGFKHYQHHKSIYPFFVIGFTLAMSSFASYIFQLVELYQKGQWWSLFIYFCLSNLLGLLFVVYLSR